MVGSTNASYRRAYGHLARAGHVPPDKNLEDADLEDADPAQSTGSDPIAIGKLRVPVVTLRSACLRPKILYPVWIATLPSPRSAIVTTPGRATCVLDRSPTSWHSSLA